MSPYRHVPHPHILHEALQIQEHLLSQDRELERLITHLGTAPPAA